MTEKKIKNMAGARGQALVSLGKTADSSLYFPSFFILALFVMLCCSKALMVHSRLSIVIKGSMDLLKLKDPMNSHARLQILKQIQHNSGDFGDFVFFSETP